MAQDSFTEVTRKSWGGRIGSAFGGAIVGIVLFLGSFALLFWNEGRSVQTHRSLSEGSKAVVSVSSDRVSDANEGKLIHFSGSAITPDTLKDEDFNVSVNAVKLKRTVEMFQWKEKSESKTEKKMGGGEETTTTYSYSKAWSDELISSSDFKRTAGHENPAAMLYNSYTKAAGEVRVGDFSLADVFIDKMGDFEELSIRETAIPQKMKVSVVGNAIYTGADPQSPKIGDLRISFSVVRPAAMSVVGMQSGKTLGSYQTKAGKPLALLQTGTIDAAEMFTTAQKENAMLTWVLRLVGFIMMIIGLMAISKPLAVLGDFLPFIGNVIGFATGVAAVLISLALSIITIAIAWIYYRPILGVPLLAVGIAVLVLGYKSRKKRKQLSASGGQTG
jgi:hypothetical protein